MAVIKTGTVEFQDAGGKKSKMMVRGVADLAAVKQFATQMVSRTRCKVVGVSYHETDSATIGSATTGKWDSVDQKAEYFIEDTATGLVNKYQIPAPLESMFDHIDKVGYVMKFTQGDAIKDDFNTATGKTYRFHKGRFKGINTQSQA